MTETRPSPLVPPDTDLRSFAWLPLPVSFTASNDWLCVSAPARAAMVSLVVASWHQVPASSLPANDTALAVLAQAGPNWRRIRAEALRGWTECDDGRLYHPALSGIAMDSMLKRRLQMGRTEAARTAKLAKLASVTDDVTDPVTDSTGEERTGEDNPKEKKAKRKCRASVADAGFAGWTADDHMALIGWQKAKDTGEWRTTDARRNALEVDARMADLLADIERRSPKAFAHITETIHAPPRPSPYSPRFL